MICRLMLAVLFLSVASSAVEAPQVSTYWHRGTQVLVQTLDGVTVQACIFQTENNYNRVDVRIVNQSDKAFDVQPELFSFAETSPKAVQFAQLSEQDLQRSISRNVAFWNLLNGFSAALSTSASVLALTVSSSYTAQTQGTKSSEKLAASSAASREGITETILRRTTLYPDKSLMGSVFFKRDGKLDGAVLTISIGERRFSLPFGSATPASAEIGAPQELGGSTRSNAFQSAADGGVSMATLGLSGDERSIYGFYVTAVVANSPAAQAKIAPGDIIVTVNGNRVRSEEDILALIPINSTRVVLEIGKAYWATNHNVKRVLTFDTPF